MLPFCFRNLSKIFTTCKRSPVRKLDSLSWRHKVTSFFLAAYDGRQKPERRDFIFLSDFLDRKDYDNHLLQSRLHFRIHAALQDIKYKRKAAKEASKREKQVAKRSKQGANNNSAAGAMDDDAGDSLEDSSSLVRQDSSSSFETAPEYSSDEEGETETTEPKSSPNARVVIETSV